MRILVINEAVDIKILEKILISMFRQEYAQLYVRTNGSVSRNLILYKKLDNKDARPIGDLDIDVKREISYSEIKQAEKEFLQLINDTIDDFNTSNSKNFYIRDEPRFSHEYIEKSGKRLAMIKTKIAIYDKNNDRKPALLIDMHMKLFRNAVDLVTIENSTIKGTPLAEQICTKIDILTTPGKRENCSGKDLIDLNSIISQRNVEIKADDIVEEMKERRLLSAKDSKLDYFKENKTKTKLEKLYNLEKSKRERFDVVFDRILTFITPLLSKEGQNYDYWEYKSPSNYRWVLKSN